MTSLCDPLEMLRPVLRAEAASHFKCAFAKASQLRDAVARAECHDVSATMRRMYDDFQQWSNAAPHTAVALSGPNVHHSPHGGIIVSAEGKDLVAMAEWVEYLVSIARSRDYIVSAWTKPGARVAYEITLPEVAPKNIDPVSYTKQGIFRDHRNAMIRGAHGGEARWVGRLFAATLVTLAGCGTIYELYFTGITGPITALWIVFMAFMWPAKRLHKLIRKKAIAPGGEELCPFVMVIFAAAAGWLFADLRAVAT
jgi:hypothetical protein